MKTTLTLVLNKALEQLEYSGQISGLSVPSLKRCRDRCHGDYMTNVALILAGHCHMTAWQLASLIIHAMPVHPWIDRCEPAGPGFINCFMTSTARSDIIRGMLTDGQCVGENASRLLVEPASFDAVIPYIRYAYTRTHSVITQWQGVGANQDEWLGSSELDMLTGPVDLALLALVCYYPDIMSDAITMNSSVMVLDYLYELANETHCYYNAIQLQAGSKQSSLARLCVLKAVRQVLHNGLQWLGMLAPESM